MIVFVVLLNFVSIICGDKNGDRLFKDLLTHYSTYERPLLNASDRVVVDFGVALHQLVGLDEKSQTMQTILFFRFTWVDVNLDWEPSQYGDIRELRMPIHKIWKPDILLYNSADTPWDRTYPVPAVVYHNGTVRWMPPGYVKSSCKVDVTYFPFDDQVCKYKYSSWTYDYYKLDLRNESSVVDTSFYMQSSDWIVIDTKVLRTVAKYECCPNPYVDATFYIHLRRRTLPYGTNLIMPTLITSLMAILAFALPSESGEKVALDISVLLSLLFCMQMLADRSPPTSESIPLLAIFFLSCIFLVSLSVVMSVTVLNRHHSDPDTAEMTDLEKLILLDLLPKLVGIRRPPIDSLRFPISSDIPEKSERPVKKKKRKSIFEKKFINISTCDECEEHLLSPCTCRTLIEVKPRQCKVNNVDIPPSYATVSRRSMPPTPENQTQPGHDFADQPSSSGIGNDFKLCSLSKVAHNTQRSLETITRCIKKGATDEMNKNDWQFAARSIDRLCLYMFFGLIFGISCVFYFSAPFVVA